MVPTTPQKPASPRPDTSWQEGGITQAFAFGGPRCVSCGSLILSKAELFLTAGVGSGSPVSTAYGKKVNLMSAPQTNIEKQKRWHRGPLIGMALVVIFGVGLIFFWLIKESANGATPGTAEDAQPDDAPLDIAPPVTETVPDQ